MKPNIKFTIAFLIKENKILMIWRNKPPWAGYWNGLGGKIETGETPEQSIIREIQEEAEIDISKSKIENKGIVTWTNFSDRTHNNSEKIGMHVFIVRLPNNFPIWTAAKHTREGILTWLTVQTILENKEKDIALNVPVFLKPMIEATDQKEYFFEFKTDKEFKMTIL